MPRKMHRIPQRHETVEVFGIVHRVYMVDRVLKATTFFRNSDGSYGGRRKPFSSDPKDIGGLPVRYTISMYCEQWQQHWIEPTTLRVKKPVNCIDCLVAGA